MRPGFESSAPLAGRITQYDRVHLLTYAQLLDVEAGDWRVAARDLLGLDVDADEVAAHRCYASHLARARWVEDRGFALLMGEVGL